MAREYRRFQARELAGPVALRPAPVQSDTFAAPEKPIIDNNKARLADALGAFNSALSAFGTAAMKRQAAYNKQVGEEIANRTIAGHTAEDYNAMVKAGQLPAYENPFARGIYDQHTGMMAGDRAFDQLQERIGRGEIDLADENLDIDKLLTEQSAADLEALRGNPTATASFKRRMVQGRESLLKAAATARNKAFVQKQNGIAFDQFNRVFDLFKGADPEITNNFIRGMYRDLKRANIPYAALDDQLMTVVKNRVKDGATVEAALEVLSQTRTGEDGATIPALGSKPKYAKDVLEIHELAKDTLATKFDDETMAGAVSNAREALERQDGSFWTLKDTSYSNPITGRKVINATEVKKAAITDFLSWSEQQAAERKESPEVRLKREFRVLQQSDIPNPAWKDTLEGAARAFTNPQALSDPNNRNRAKAAYSLYHFIASRNYPYIKGTLKLDKNSRDFFMVMDVARNKMGLNDDQALDLAAQAIRTPENENDLAVRQTRSTEVANLVTSMDFANWWPGGGAENQGTLQKRVMEIASILSRVPGLTPDQAVERAAEVVRDNSLFINGHAVPDTGWLPPPEMKKYIEDYLDIFASQHGAANGIKDGSELSIEPFGGSTFRIIDRNEGYAKPLYVMDAQGQVKPALITMGLITQLKEKRQGETERKIEEASREEITRPRLPLPKPGWALDLLQKSFGNLTNK